LKTTLSLNLLYYRPIIKDTFQTSLFIKQVYFAENADFFKGALPNHSDLYLKLLYQIIISIAKISVRNAITRI